VKIGQSNLDSTLNWIPSYLQCFEQGRWLASGIFNDHCEGDDSKGQDFFIRSFKNNTDLYKI
jgi:hypothetical protein